MEFIQDGKMDKAAELLSGDALSATDGAVLVTEAPSVKIGDVKVGETTTGERGPEVAVSYSVNGEPVRSKLAAVQVRIENRDVYRVAVGPAVLQADAPIKIGKQEIKSGKAILGPGVYEVKRVFNSELIADKSCTGTVTVSTSADGAGQLSEGGSCLKQELTEMKPVGPVVDQAKGKIEEALADLVGKCSHACRPGSWEQVTDPAQMGKLPEGCAYDDFLGFVRCAGDTRTDEVQQVSLARLKLSGKPDLKLFISDTAGKTLGFSTESIQKEVCSMDCDRDSGWKPDGIAQIGGSYEHGEVAIR